MRIRRGLCLNLFNFSTLPLDLLQGDAIYKRAWGMLLWNLNKLALRAKRYQSDAAGSRPSAPLTHSLTYLKSERGRAILTLHLFNPLHSTAAAVAVADGGG